MSFNLDPPAGFIGFDEQKPTRIYRRNLPHWRQAGATYFVTFHLADALPVTKRRELLRLRDEWLRSKPQTRSSNQLLAYAAKVFGQVDAIVDAGHGACWLRKPPYGELLEETVLRYADERYEIGSFVNMGNHCHLLIRPYADFELEALVGGFKSVIARKIVKAEKLSPPLWNEESYDRVVRDVEHLWRVLQYIGRNPARAGLPHALWHRWINPNWQKAGWDFVDE